ncbi:MAG TPA: hypothetical protein VF424_17690 [Vicinamibacterales bacterium]
MTRLPLRVLCPWSPILAALIAVSAGSANRLSAQAGRGADLKQAAAGFHELFMHDDCTGEYAPQPDTCLHKQLIEKPFTFGGAAGTVHDVRLRIRGIFEPTTIAGGETPDPAHPYYQVGGTIRAREWSAWHIEVSNPKQTYWLNHYPKVSHTIYAEDFEATIPVAGGASVVVRVVDGNDRQIDNSEPGRPDRQQIIKGVVDKPLAGQMLRIDVVQVTAR